MWIWAIIFLITLVIIILLGVFITNNNNNTETIEDLKESLKIKQSYITSFNTFNQKIHNNIDIPLFYINLERSKDRNEFMINQIKKNNVSNWERIEAVNGKDDPTISYTNSFNLTNSEIGCTLSHLKAIKKAYDKKLDYVLILEDDTCFDFVPLWEHPLSWYIKNIKDWTILQLHCHYDYNKLKNIYHNPKDNEWTTLAYIINKKGMKKILKKVWIGDKFILSNRMSKRGEADWFIYDLSDFKKRYIINPPLFTANNLIHPSTIRDTHIPVQIINSNKHYDIYFNNLFNKLIKNTDADFFRYISNPKIIYKNSQPKTDIDIVFAYYKYDISWFIETLKTLDKNSYRLFVYSKGEETSAELMKYAHSWITLDNIGREGHSYLYHIIDNYNNSLSKKTFFVKDSGIKHMDVFWLNQNKDKSLPRGPNESNKSTESNFKLDTYYMKHDQNKKIDVYFKSPDFLRPLSKWFNFIFNDDFKSVKKVIYSGVILSKSNFKNISLDLWLRLALTLTPASNIETGHYMERLWWYILSKC